MAAPKRFPQDLDEIAVSLADGDYLMVVDVSDTTDSDAGSLLKVPMEDVREYVTPTGTWTDASPTVATGDSLVSAATFVGGRYMRGGDNVVTCSGQLDVTVTGAGAVLAYISAPVAFSLTDPSGRGGGAVADVNAILAGSQPIVGTVIPYTPDASTGVIAIAFVSAGAAELSFPFTMQYGVTS